MRTRAMSLERPWAEERIGYNIRIPKLEVVFSVSSVRSGVNSLSGRLRTMTAADIPAGMRLKELAGWNQTPEDWERFLEADPGGCFVAEWNGQVAGTVATIIYEQRFAWIGMVLVDPQVRGKGIGTALLLKAIDYLDARHVPCIKLDATPQGKPIYIRLGFRIEYEIERLSLTRDASGDSHCPGVAPTFRACPERSEGPARAPMSPGATGQIRTLPLWPGA